MLEARFADQLSILEPVSLARAGARFLRTMFYLQRLPISNEGLVSWILLLESSCDTRIVDFCNVVETRTDSVRVSGQHKGM